jgi:hypothetical protein
MGPHLMRRTPKYVHGFKRVGSKNVAGHVGQWNLLKARPPLWKLTEQP